MLTNHKNSLYHIGTHTWTKVYTVIIESLDIIVTNGFALQSHVEFECYIHVWELYHYIFTLPLQSSSTSKATGSFEKDMNSSSFGVTWWKLRQLLWVYCPGNAGVKGNDRADRLAGKATIASGLRLGISKVLKSLRHYMWAQSQGHHTIDRLERREA